jgi:hypothetical protein
MPFFIALPSKNKKYGTKIANVQGCEIYESSGRFYAFKDDFQVGELINGADALNKYYKNDFNVWVKAIKSKDLTKVKKMYIEANKIIRDCDFLKHLWRG